MRVLSVNASSRKNGNTSFACRLLANAISGKEGTVVHFDLAAMDISYCRGCFACEVKGKCVVKDDWQRVYEALWDAEALVFGTPVYMSRESALARVFIERGRCLVSHTHAMAKQGKTMFEAAREFAQEHPGEDYGLPSIRLPEGKKIYLIVTKNHPDTFAGEQIMQYLELMFGVVGGETKKRWLITGTLEAHELEKRIDRDGLPPGYIRGPAFGLIPGPDGCLPHSLEKDR